MAKKKRERPAPRDEGGTAPPPSGGEKAGPISRPAELPLDLPPDLLDVLRSSDAAEINRLIRIASYFAGPLPPPELLGRYGEVVREGGERIVVNWETESRHRRSLERAGQWIAASLGLAAIIGAVASAALGEPIVGGVIVGLTMLGIAATGAIQLFRQKRR